MREDHLNSRDTEGDGKKKKFIHGTMNDFFGTIAYYKFVRNRYYLTNFFLIIFKKEIYYFLFLFLYFFPRAGVYSIYVFKSPARGINFTLIK